jgi:hypothetical protein
MIYFIVSCTNGVNFNVAIHLVPTFLSHYVGKNMGISKKTKLILFIKKIINNSTYRYRALKNHLSDRGFKIIEMIQSSSK